MKRYVALALFALSSAGVVHASEPVRFEGALMERGMVSVRFDETIPRGQKRSMELPEHQVVEMSVDADGQSTVRLLDRAGAELHSVVSPATGPNPWRFQYAQCKGGAFAYSSPPGKKSGCP